MFLIKLLQKYENVFDYKLVLPCEQGWWQNTKTQRLHEAYKNVPIAHFEKLRV